MPSFADMDLWFDDAYGVWWQVPFQACDVADVYTGVYENLNDRQLKALCSRRGLKFGSGERDDYWFSREHCIHDLEELDRECGRTHQILWVRNRYRPRPLITYVNEDGVTILQLQSSAEAPDAPFPPPPPPPIGAPPRSPTPPPPPPPPEAAAPPPTLPKDHPALVLRPPPANKNKRKSERTESDDEVHVKKWRRGDPVQMTPEPVELAFRPRRTAKTAKKKVAVEETGEKDKKNGSV